MKSLTTLYFLLLNAFVSAQPTDTSYINQLIRNANTIEEESPEKSINYLKQALQLAESRKDQYRKAAIWNLMGEYYRTFSEYDSSLLFFRQALQYGRHNEDMPDVIRSLQGIAQVFMRRMESDSGHLYLNRAYLLANAENDIKAMADIHINRGNIYLNEHMLTESLEQFIKAASLQDSLLHNPVELARALANIGNIQQLLGNYDKALDYTNRSLQLSLDNNQPSVAAYCYRLVGRIYRKINQPDKALESYRLSQQYYLKINDRYNTAETHNSIGNIYYDKEEYDQANAEYISALSFAKSIPSSSMMAYVYSALSYNYHKLKRYSLAIAYSDSSRIYAKGTNPYLLMDSYQVMSMSEAGRKNYKAALEYHELYTYLKDSLTNIESRKATEEIEAKYKHTVQQQEIELLKRNQLLKEETLDRQQANLRLIMTALFSVIIISVILVNRYRVLNRTRRQLEIEKMRSDIARDLHDDLGSALSSINIISQMGITQKNGQAENHFQRINEQSSRMMESMSDIVWSINPENDTLDKLLIKMKEFAAEILEPKGTSYQFHEPPDSAGIHLNAGKRKNLFLIFKEAINNAAKYSDGNNITIHLKETDNTLTLVVQDNGKGFLETEVKHGNGLRNMEARAQQMNATLSRHSNPNEGTAVTVNLTIT